MMYVTFDASGNLTGSYNQDLHPSHAGVHIQVSKDVCETWTIYRANESRDGVVANEVVPADPPAPESVPMLNLQLILIEDGKLATVQAILDSMAGAEGAKAQAYWSKALTARRDNYLVAQLWPAIGYDEAGFHAAWLRAAALNP